MTTAQLLGEALRDRRRQEGFERALGRILRRHSLGYPDYIRIMSEVRTLAQDRRLDILEAARALRDDQRGESATSR